MRKLAVCFLLLVLMFPPARGQSSEQSQMTSAEKKKAANEREKKTLALMEEILNDMQSLRLPENRIRVAMSLAGQLWQRDEKRARALFKDAASSLNEITAAFESGDPDYLSLSELPRQLRQEMVQVVANHDPKLAVEFLRTTRIEDSSRPPNSGMTNLEANLEMRVAIQIAAKDPEQAVSLAEESMKINLDYEALSLLYNLQSKRKALAEKFFDDVMGGIRTYGIGNNAATPIAVNLLRTWIENNRGEQDPGASRTTSNLSLSNLNENAAREISNMIINAFTSNAPAKTVQAYGRRFIDGPASFYPGQLLSIYQQIKPILPDMEKLVPERMSAMRSRIAEFEQSSEAQQATIWRNFQEVTQNGTPEAILEAVKTAPTEYADSLLQQAALKAISQGNENQARQIVEKISDPRQRIGVNMQIARQGYYRAIEEKKTAEARAFIPRLPLEEQVSLLTQMANSAAAEGDKAAALQLLGEAQALLPNRATNYGLLQAQLMIAGSYERLEPGRSAPIVDKVIDQTNELVAAALVLNGFDVMGYFRNDEFVIAGGSPLNMIAESCGRELGAVARGDLDRARLAAERFQRPEMRLIALLQIAQAISPNETNSNSQEN
jgi:hypothetical protein